MSYMPAGTTTARELEDGRDAGLPFQVRDDSSMPPSSRLQPETRRRGIARVNPVSERLDGCVIACRQTPTDRSAQDDRRVVPPWSWRASSARPSRRPSPRWRSPTRESREMTTRPLPPAPPVARPRGADRHCRRTRRPERWRAPRLGVRMPRGRSVRDRSRSGVTETFWRRSQYSTSCRVDAGMLRKQLKGDTHR